MEREIVDRFMLVIMSDVFAPLFFPDFEFQVVRQFLNAMNMSPRGPKSIIPIQYLYLFTGGTQLNPPEVREIKFEYSFFQ